MKIFIVLHHEIMGTPDNCRTDEMLFYTCDSLKKALSLIRKSWVVRWSWWEIKTQELNSHDWPEHVGYFGPRGGKLAKPPYEKCVALFKRNAEQSRPRKSRSVCFEMERHLAATR